MKICESLLDRRKEIISGLYGRYQLSLNLAQRGLQSSFYYFLPECYELETQQYLLRFVKPGMTTMDVGAHVGLFTILLAHRVGTFGKVYSFEPEAKNFLSLKQNLELNGLRWVHPFQAALSDQTGEDILRVNRSDASPALNRALGNCPRPSDVSHQTVQTVALDDFVERGKINRIDLIKIDAEQSEPLILEGARRSLRKGIISEVICEIHSTAKPHAAGRDSVRKVFYSYGFKSFVLNPVLSNKKFLAELFPEEPVRGLQNLLFRK